MIQPRALQICPNDHPPFLDLCKAHAAALSRAGMAVDTVFLAAPRGERWNTATYLGIERGARRMVAALREHVAGRSYQLAVAHRYRAYQVVTRMKHAVAGATIVTVAHEFGMFGRHRRRWRRRLVANDVYFAGVSQPVVDEMHKHGLPPTHTFVLPNPADVERLDTERLSIAVARERLGVPESAYVVGVVGRLHPEKRLLLALEGFAAADRLPVDSRLVFIGDGAQRGSLESLASRRGIEARVHFMGWLSDAPQYMSGFDVLLFSSGLTEAFGMSLLEAMLARVAIVCADTPGPRGVLGPEGLYFSADDARGVADALGRCFGLSEDAREQLRSTQRARAERQFSLAAVADIYREVLSTDATLRADGS